MEPNESTSAPSKGSKAEEDNGKKTSSKKNDIPSSTLPITPLDNVQDNAQTATNEAGPGIDEPFEVGRAKKNSKGYNIDYASTVEDAYDELNKILGSDGIKKLTGDTQSLMKQQMQLAESMKSMGPMIQSMAPMMKQAQDMLGGMGEGKEGLGGIMEIAKKLTNKTN